MRTTTVVWFAASLLCLQFLASLDAAPSARYDLVYSSRHYFTSGRGHSYYQIRRLRLGDDTSTQLTHAQTDCGNPLASHDGRRIAYQTDTDIWLMAADGGSNRRILATKPRWTEVSAAAWTPDGRQLLLEGWQDEGSTGASYVFDIASGRVRKLMDDIGLRLSPRGYLRMLSYEPGGHIRMLDQSGRKLWSVPGCEGDWLPAGDRVVVSPYSDPYSGETGYLAVRRASDGKQIRAFALYGQLESAWSVCECSPTGDSVVVGGRGGDSSAPFKRFYMLSLSTGKESLLGEGNGPCWAPNGRYVAWYTMRELQPLPDKRVVWTSQIIVYDVRTGKRWRLTSGLQHNECVSWLRCR